MATVVTQGSSPLAASISMREKGSRSKRKFRAEPPLTDSDILNSSPHGECPNYDFFQIEKSPENTNMLLLPCCCNLCRTITCISKEELELEQPHEVDWTNFNENELEDITLRNLNEMFKGAIKTIITYGYTEEVATNAVLNHGICCGCKCSVSDIVDNALAFLRSGKEVDFLLGENVAQDLQNLARSVLADMVNVLRALRPFFSAGDAMWYLLISDFNVSHACAVECDLLCATNDDKKLSSCNINQPEPEVNTICSTSQTLPEVQVSVSRKTYHLGSSKKESLLRHKSVYLEKDHRTFRSKATPRASKHTGVRGLLLSEKARSISDCSGVSVKCTMTKTCKTAGLDSSQTDGNPSLSLSDSISSHHSKSMKKAASPTPLTVANTELSLSLLPSTSNNASCGMGTDPHCSYAGMALDKGLGNWTPQIQKDELILKLIPRLRELEAQKQEWTEWAQQKVMQTAHRLSKDRIELQTMRQEIEEVGRLKKEKQMLEENTKKKFTEMENALSKASCQIEKSNATARSLEVENFELRKEMESAKLQAEESAASCQEVSKRQMKILKKLQSWDRQKLLLQEELTNEKHLLSQLQRHLKEAKEHHDQMEAKWKLEEKSKSEVLFHVKTERKVREKLESSRKSKENEIMIVAENGLQKFKDDIRRLESQITQLRLLADSSKLVAIRSSTDSSYALKVVDGKKNNDRNNSVNKLLDLHEQEAEVRRDRECVMCLSAEMSVVFLPCAHQVVCGSCNELHEREGMKDCPSCRTTIQRRICIRGDELFG
ncbi:Putative E3 ubiquitin-protein ligase RF298 [Apostasia shenzhenica]|uniref:E3 ubiquitin-protein ligase RF298 n=1 Tax=Apostasia shenzhenica TaxID=1088818 RepID=A0A2I0BFE4_9ASPA|nr:Putative E3 ubiquitin-protein ligase RF298 [Apostasia shenzhenica]